MFRAVLDANVLYPAHLRDVLLSLAASGFYQPRWSPRIQDEWIRSVLARRPDLTADQLAYTRREMERAFPEACVEAGPALETRLDLPDPDDRHVLAAAIAARAEIIVTANLSDFPAATLRPLGVEAVPPDAFIIALMQTDLEGVVAALRAHRARLRRPPISAAQYLSYLEQARLAATVAVLQDWVEAL